MLRPWSGVIGYSRQVVKMPRTIIKICMIGMSTITAVNGLAAGARLFRGNRSETMHKGRGWEWMHVHVTSAVESAGQETLRRYGRVRVDDSEAGAADEVPEEFTPEEAPDACPDKICSTELVTMRHDLMARYAQIQALIATRRAHWCQMNMPIAMVWVGVVCKRDKDERRGGTGEERMRRALLC